MLRSLLAALATTVSAFAAGPYGDWYATLATPGGNLRIALHLTGEGSEPKATLDSIDQGASGLVASGAEVTGGKVAIDWSNLRARLEAAVNEAGSELAGTWSQGPGKIPVKFTRETFVIERITPVPLTAGERDFLISHLEKSRKLFLDSIRGVSKEQWTFKAAPDRWSIGECAEHLVTTEDALFNLAAKQMLKAPVRAGARKGQADDERVIARIVDRSNKAKAPEMLVPSGKYDGPEAIEKAFNERRDRSVEFVKTTAEDLRGRAMNGMDGYQYLVMMSGHTLRHTAQLNEVKTAAQYPK